MAVECPQITVNDGRLSVRLPGGASVSAIPAELNTSPLKLARSLMAQANSAMTALQPVFNLVGAILAIKDFAQAVPQLVFNPKAVVDAIKDLVEKVDALVTLLPQLSVPAMVLDLVDVIIVYLQGIQQTLEALAEQEVKADAAKVAAQASGLTVLAQVAECANDQIGDVLAGMQASSAGIDELIGLLNALGSLVPGMPEIPTLSDLGDNVEGAAATVGEAIQVLTAVRSTIPL